MRGEGTAFPFVGICWGCDAPCLVFCVEFCNQFFLFSFGHCIACPSSILDCPGHGSMLVGFITSYAIGVYH